MIWASQNFISCSLLSDLSYLLLRTSLNRNKSDLMSSRVKKIKKKKQIRIA